VDFGGFGTVPAEKEIFGGDEPAKTLFLETCQDEFAEREGAGFTIFGYAEGGDGVEVYSVQFEVDDFAEANAKRMMV